MIMNTGHYTRRSCSSNHDEERTCSVVAAEQFARVPDGQRGVGVAERLGRSLVVVGRRQRRVVGLASCSSLPRWCRHRLTTLLHAQRRPTYS